MTDPTASPVDAEDPAEDDGAALLTLDPDAAEAQAQADADAAAAEVARLEDAVLDGAENVTHLDLQAAEGRSRWSALRATAVARKAERARVARRLAACNALRAVIEDASTAVGSEVAAALDTLGAAEAEVLRLVGAHDDRATGWRAAAARLGVPESAQPPQADDGWLALSPLGSTDQVRTSTRVAGVIGGRGLVARYLAGDPNLRAAIVADVRRAGGFHA